MAAAAAAILLSVRTETLTNHGMQTECGRPLAVCAACCPGMLSVELQLADAI